MSLGVRLQAPARRRRRVRAAALAMGVLVVGLVVAAPASAHDTLVGSDPADGAVLAAPPTQVVLTFSAAPAAVGAEVLVQGPDGAAWSAGPATVDGVTVTQALTPGAPAGAYTVTWRAVAADGHPVTGTLAYSVTAASPTPTPTVTRTAEPTPTTAVPAPTPTVTITATPAATPVQDGSTWRGAWPWLLAGVVVVGAAVTATVRRQGVRRD